MNKQKGEELDGDDKKNSRGQDLELIGTCSVNTLPLAADSTS